MALYFVVQWFKDRQKSCFGFQFWCVWCVFVCLCVCFGLFCFVLITFTPGLMEGKPED